MSNHHEVDPQLETFLVLKYKTLDMALMNWLTSPLDFSKEENEFLEQYVKSRFPNLNLINSEVKY